MLEPVSQSSFSTIFEADTPLLDVRAPIEFANGAFPKAINLPLLDDGQREAIGKQYKRHGQEAAIRLGHKLVSGEHRQQLQQQWLDFIHANPNALLYCFRGGLRSKTVQGWLAELGVDIRLIEGGYKALRQYLITAIDNFAENTKIIIVAGKTGSAKTHLLNKLQHSLDLEGLANHRGSSFGKRYSAQPTQIDFENKLAITLLKKQRKSPVHAGHYFCEDESRAIGSVSIPMSLHQKMLRSDIAVIEDQSTLRVDTILNDYIASNFIDFNNADASSAHERFSEYLLSALQRIRKRLGGENFASVNADMQAALDHQRSHQDLELHRVWIEKLLNKYYDPMYEYQLNKKIDRVVFRGTRDEFSHWAAAIDKSNGG